tara:strand:+ start:603 stop:908 length:306 start_codon:yes stop_codon:yes gene_type:complete
MARHHNISGEITQELLASGNNEMISSISLCNIHASTKCTVDVYIEKQSKGKFYFMKSLTLPVGVTLVYDNLTFDNSTDGFGLFVKLTKSASETPTVDIILM